MAKRIPPLTPSQVQNAKGGESVHPVTKEPIDPAKPYKLRDGGGLYLLVTPDGAKLWRMDYRRPVTGKQNTIGLGAFPVVKLADARDKREAVRKQLDAGTDPSEQRKADHAAKLAQAQAQAVADRQASEGTFRAVAESWAAMKRKTWADETRRKAELVLRDYLLPALGDADMATLSSKDALAVLEAMAETAPNLARKARGYMARIAHHAMKQGFREDGRVLLLESEAIKDAIKAAKGHIPAATATLADVRAVVLAVDAYAIPVTRAALTIAMLTAQRPGNVAAMEWAEVDLDAAEWNIPAGKMKTGHAHTVPLATQAVALLRDMLAYTDGKQYVFPPLARQRTEHLHRDTLSKALRDSGLRDKHAAHGFRAMFRTVARERLGIAEDVLEAQLAHAKKGEVQAAYDRTGFIEERRAVAQRWADYLDTLKAGGNVVPIHRKAS